MHEIRIPARELESLLFGPGYTLNGVTLDTESQTITLHTEHDGKGYSSPPITAASALSAIPKVLFVTGW